MYLSNEAENEIFFHSGTFIHLCGGEEVWKCISAFFDSHLGERIFFHWTVDMSSEGYTGLIKIMKNQKKKLLDQNFGLWTTDVCKWF